jgi:hypothetical protein
VGVVQDTAADGTIKFSRVPVGPVNFAATVPGLEGSPPVIIPAQTTPMLGVAPDNAEETRMQQRLANLALPSTQIIPLPGSPVTNPPGGSDTNPLIIHLTPPSGPPNLYAGPVQGYAPLNVKFNPTNAGATPVVKLKNLGTNSTVTLPAGSLEVDISNPGSYSLILENGSNVVLATAGPIVALQSPNHTVANPSTVDSSVTGKLNQTVWCHYFSTQVGGGAIREADIELATEASPKNVNNAFFADLTAIQHTYAASGDLDLAPYTAAGQPFANDNFTAGFPTYVAKAANRQTAAQGLGWKDEDYNYTLPLGRWYDPASHNDIVDGISQLDQNDNNYNNSILTGESTSFTYFRLACSLGGHVVPAPPAESFIYPVIRDYIKPSDHPDTFGLLLVHAPIPNRADSPLPEHGFASTRARIRLTSDLPAIPDSALPLRDAHLLVGSMVSYWQPPVPPVP